MPNRLTTVTVRVTSSDILFRLGLENALASPADGLGRERGGVGYYADSNFVHVDTGRVRVW